MRVITVFISYKATLLYKIDILKLMYSDILLNFHKLRAYNIFFDFYKFRAHNIF